MEGDRKGVSHLTYLGCEVGFRYEETPRSLAFSGFQGTCVTHHTPLHIPPKSRLVRITHFLTVF